MADSKYFGIPFATSGDKAVIPEATQPSGAISFTQGFGPDYERDPLTDPLAKRVPRDETNELYFQITNALKYLQLYGTPEWYAFDGSGNPVNYPLSARVRYDAGAGMQAWRSLVVSNTATPGSDATKWALDTPFDISTLEATLAEALAGSIGTKIVTPRRLASSVQRNVWNYGDASGTPDALTITLSPAPATISTGFRVSVKTTATNTIVGPTLNVNGLGAAPIVSQKGIALPAGSLPIGMCEFIWSGSAWVFLGIIVQPLLTSLTLYVRSDGNDNNTGLINSAAGAFATLQGAYNAIISRYSSNGYPVTLQLGTPGTYVGLSHTSWPGEIIVNGNTASPGSYIITGAAGTSPVASFFHNTGRLRVRGVTIQPGAASGRGLHGVGAISQVETCNFVIPSSGAGVVGESGARVTLVGAQNISGSGATFASILGGAQLLLGDATSYTGTVSGNPSYNTFVVISQCGVLAVRNGTISGLATGQRYQAVTNGVIDTSGAGASFFPGSVPGAVATGGQYV